MRMRMSMPRSCKLLVISAVVSITFGWPFQAAADIVAPTDYFSQAIACTSTCTDTLQVGTTSVSASSGSGAVTAAADRATAELHAYSNYFNGTGTAIFGDT